MAQNAVERLFVIGGSSGSFEVLLQVLPLLLPLANAAIVLVLHRKSTADSALSDVLAHRTNMIVKETEEKEPVLPGVIYVAPAGYHLLIETDCSFSLDSSESVNFSRPSIDVCFESAAEALGNKVTGILLSGSNIDGTQGLRRIKAFGGVTAVQNPDTADSSYMPRQALDGGVADYTLEIDQIAPFINDNNGV